MEEFQLQSEEQQQAPAAVQPRLLHTPRCTGSFNQAQFVAGYYTTDTSLPGSLLRIVSASFSGGPIQIWHAETGALVHDIEHGPRRDVTTYHTPDHLPRIVSSSEDGQIKIWDGDGPDFELLRAIPAHRGYVRPLFIYNDPREGRPRVASGGEDATVTVHDAESGTCVSILRGFAGNLKVLSGYVTPDGMGQRVMGGDERGKILVFDPEAGQLLYELAGHEPKTIRAFAVFEGASPPHIPFIVTGSHEKKILVFDGESGMRTLELEGQGFSLAVYKARADDHPVIAAGSESSSIRLW
jgi:hypothetical protein